MRTYIYSKVSAKTHTCEQHRSVNPDLEYWVMVRFSDGSEKLLVFTDLASYTTTIAGFKPSNLVDFGTFKYKMPAITMNCA